jgi:hypothetical protein
MCTVSVTITVVDTVFGSKTFTSHRLFFFTTKWPIALLLIFILKQLDHALSSTANWNKYFKFFLHLFC